MNALTNAALLAAIEMLRKAARGEATRNELDATADYLEALRDGLSNEPASRSPSRRT